MLLLRAALAEDRRKGTLSAPAQTMGESPADLPGDDMDDQGGPAA
jgi:hypothetical protein